MSGWRAKEQQMTAAVINEFADEMVCQLVPMRIPPNRKAEIDKSRKPRDIRGIFDWPWDKAIVHPAYAMDSTRAPTLFVHACCLLGDEQTGDIVLIPYRGRRLQMEIIDIRRDGESGVWLDFSQHGVQL